MSADRLRLVAVVLAGLALGGAGYALGRASRPPWPSYDAVFTEVAPGVVNVAVRDRRDADKAASARAFGSAFAVAPDEVVTARHLVVGAEHVVVRDLGGVDREAELVGADARTDLALLRVPGLGARPLPLGDSDDLPIGQTVIAIGNPFGLSHSLSVGVLSGRGRRIGEDGDAPRVDFLQLSVPLNPGNSGGPIVDEEGRVIAVLSGTHAQGQSIAFAVPVEILRRSLPVLRTGARISRAFLGLRVAPDGSGGVVVESVIPASPADKAGLRPGDHLTAFDDVPLHAPADLVHALDHLTGGEQVAVRLLRDGALAIVDVVLADWELQPLVVSGMTLVPSPGTGGRVVAVRPGSRGEAAGIAEGDEVRAVDGRPMRAPADVKEALATGGAAQLELTRAGTVVAVQLPP